MDFFFISLISFLNFVFVISHTAYNKLVFSRSIPVYIKPFQYLDWLPWAYEILNINQWKNVDDIG